MVERFNRTCLMLLSMFVNDRRDNWSELLPFVMHAYGTSVHESTGYSPFRLMMGEECSLPQDVSTDELRTNGCVMPWKSPTTTFGIPYIERPPGGSGYVMSRPSIVGVTLLPSSGST